MNLAVRRRLVDRLATGLSLLAALVAVAPLVSVLVEVARRGGPHVTLAFVTSLPTAPVLPGGGIYHAIVGTLLVVAIASAIGVPLGILAGIFLSEFGDNRLGQTVRLMADVMAGIPSIVAGIFGYAAVVATYGFSAIAGGVALALIMLPVVTRTTEESLRTVPMAYREAALALGAPRWHATLSVVLPAGLGAVLTGVLLSVARIMGETAPLLLTVLTSFFLVTDPTEPVATMPYLVYDYGKSAFPKLQDQAWGAALVLLVLVLVINIAVRLLARKHTRA